MATYHQEMIPTKLLLAIIDSKQEVPFDTVFEVIGLLAAFELLPETKYTPVLRAAVYEGLYAVGAAVLHGTFRKRQRREEPIRKADTDYA